MARTNEKVEVRYRMRGNNVLIRKVRVEQFRGLLMPEASIHGVQFVVEGVGPDVPTDLHPGDVVLMKGVRGEEYHELPNDNNLLVIDAKCIMLAVEPKEA